MATAAHRRSAPLLDTDEPPCPEEVLVDPPSYNADRCPRLALIRLIENIKCLLRDEVIVSHLIQSFTWDRVLENALDTRKAWISTGPDITLKR